MLDLTKIRADTPGCESVNHLNNAGSSLPPAAVVDAMVGYLRSEEMTGGYETANASGDSLGLIYQATAEYLGCEAHEVAFTSSGSDGWWRAFTAVPLAAGDRILVNRSEFQTNAYGWLQARERGVTVDVVPNNAAGDVDLDAFDAMFDERVKLVSLTMISMSNGAIQPAAEVGDRLAGTDAVYLLDSCQAAGQLSLDVGELKCDFMNYTGRKFMRGPRGTGVLYASDDIIDRLGPAIFIDGRSATWTGAGTYEVAPHARRFEFGEHNFAGKVGLGVATQYMLDVGIDSIRARVDQLASRLRQDLSAIDSVTVHDEGTMQSGIVTFTVDGLDQGKVQAQLQAGGINLSAPGPPNAQLDLGGRNIGQILRAGVHYFNTEAELSQLCETVSGVV